MKKMRMFDFTDCEFSEAGNNEQLLKALALINDELKNGMEKVIYFDCDCNMRVLKNVEKRFPGNFFHWEDNSPKLIKALKKAMEDNKWLIVFASDCGGALTAALLRKWGFEFDRNR